MLLRWNRNGSKTPQHALRGLGHARQWTAVTTGAPPSLFFLPNTTCDIYRSTGALASQSNKIFLTEDYARAHFPNIVASTTGRWTHVAYMAPTTDIRDAYAPGATFSDTFGSTFDTIYVPNKTDSRKVAYNVVFVERVGKGTIHDLKRVYLSRAAVTWPSANL
jgi:hypothetical protein